jgi:two-component system, OmpR family, KDP operon response regulator KdpE
MIKFRLFGSNNDTKTAAVSGQGAEGPAAASSRLKTQAAPNGKRVLIVDDDPVFLKATAMTLSAAGFEVATATEGSEAISAVGEHRTDAILMDVNFPVDVCNGGMASWDGFQIMHWLRGLPTVKGARFIMVSNSDSGANRQRAQELGAVAYLQKPLKNDLLLATLNGSN